MVSLLYHNYIHTHRRFQSRKLDPAKNYVYFIK